MKKIFLFLSVVLVSLAMQATVQKADWNFSGMTEWDSGTASFNTETGVVTANQFRGVGNWGWLEKGDYDTLVVEVADHDYPVLVKVKTINDGEADQTENYVDFQKEISAKQNCLVLDLTSSKDIIKYIELDNWSKHDGATFTIKSIYALKTSGIKITRPLWNGENAFGNWEHSISVDPFARVYEYDEMVIKYTKGSDPQCQIKIRGTNAFLDFVGDYVDVSGETQASFLLSAADVAAIKSNGFYLNGKNMTITDVLIVSHRTLASEEKVVGGWNNHCEIDAAGMLADLQIGNNICVCVTNIASGEYQRVSLYSGWSNSDLLVGCEHFFGAETASGDSPLIVRFPVTGSMKQQLGSHNLLVRGCYFTMTDVYVEEGTPVAETGVNGYLTVSTAGMATFMLPFNVPSLPSGVQAYELTNDGSEEIVATEVKTLEADKPVLIVAAKGEYKFISEEGASADISGKTGTYTNGALVGTYHTINPLAQTTDDKYNYLLQNGKDGVAFYQVLDDECSLGAYRAYLSCGYNASTSKPGMPPRKSMRIVFRTDETTGLVDVQGYNVQGTKFIKDGQLYIKYKGTKYNVQGQKVR